tara:strand:- start:438 stop:1202 length:765 start_codon:yes stop_codon:yes gene_type:complete
MAIKAFTLNSKTIVSLDFDRFKTCPQICDYCYVGNMERLYPAYKAKLTRNTTWAKDNPREFAEQLNLEQRKLRKSSSKQAARLDKLPVRLYGSGDFRPEHIEFMKHLDFKFYIISKYLAHPARKQYVNQLLEIDNLTKIILSLDNQNIHFQEYTQDYLGRDKFGISYTGMADDFSQLKSQGLKTTIFFNISKKKAEREKSRQHKEQCPCDTGALASSKACSYCNKCWRSSATKGNNWNIIKQKGDLNGYNSRVI